MENKKINRTIWLNNQKILLKSQFNQTILTSINWYMNSFSYYKQIAQELRIKHPYVIVILIEMLRSDLSNKKKYVKHTKIPRVSKYRELIYDYFFQDLGESRGNELYSKWLIKYNNQDEIIIKHELEPRYKKQILARYKNDERLFNGRFWVKRDRYYNLPTPLHLVDWRNSYDNIFIWYKQDVKVACRGGSGSSGARENNSLFIYGLLELSQYQAVPSYLFLYSEDNQLLFIKKFERLTVPVYDIGANYFLDSAIDRKLKKNGQFLQWDSRDRIEKIKVSPGF